MARHPSAPGSRLETIKIVPGANLRIVTFGDGNGPTVLVMGGVHGDEIEGPLIAARIIRRLANKDVKGIVHVLAIANPLAFEAGTRTSPDGDNLNRGFPGDAKGRPTERIAEVIENRFIACADLVIDCHTGGAAISYLPTAVIPAAAWEADREAYRNILGPFGFPVFLYDSADDTPSSVFAACARAGSRILSTELGGGAGVSHETIERTANGIAAVFSAMGILPGRVADGAPFPVVVHRRRVDQSPKAEFTGLFEPTVALGDWAQKGDVIGLMHHTDSLVQPPQLIHADCAGLVLCHRAPVRTKTGDLLFKIGTPVEVGPDPEERDGVD